MLAKTTHLYSTRESRQQASALVTAALNGQAINVSLAGEQLRVTGQLSQVEPLHNGDQVLISICEHEVIIIGRIRRVDETVSNPKTEIPDHLELEARQSICLKTVHGRIEIHGNGRILINGNQLTQISKGPLKLQGSSIELN